MAAPDEATQVLDKRTATPTVPWRRLGLLALALILALFPFDWLANVWPAYDRVFRMVFNTARSHEVGHSALFFIVGALVLGFLPALRTRPALYGVLLAGGALAQETVQAIFKRELPNLGDGRDLLFDLIGITLAFLAVWLLQRTRRQRETSVPTVAHRERGMEP